MVGCTLPGQCSPGFLIPQSEAAQDLDGGYLSVEGVEVDAVDLAGGEECLTHRHGLVHTVVTDGLVIVFDWVNGIEDLLGNFQLGEFDDVAK